MVKLALKLSQGSLTKRIVQLFWTIFKQLLTPSPFALNIHVAIFLAVFFGEASLIVYVLYQAPQILWKCVFYCPIFCSCSYPCKHFVCMSWDLFVVFPGFSYEKKGTATVKSRLLFILPQLSCEKIEEGKEKQQETGEVFFKWRWWQRGRFFILFVFWEDFLPSYNSDGVF